MSLNVCLDLSRAAVAMAASHAVGVFEEIGYFGTSADRVPIEKPFRDGIKLLRDMGLGEDPLNGLFVQPATVFQTFASYLSTPVPFQARQFRQFSSEVLFQQEVLPEVVRVVGGLLLFSNGQTHDMHWLFRFLEEASETTARKDLEKAINGKRKRPYLHHNFKNDPREAPRVLSERWKERSGRVLKLFPESDFKLCDFPQEGKLATLTGIGHDSKGRQVADHYLGVIPSGPERLIYYWNSFSRVSSGTRPKKALIVGTWSL